MNNSLNYLNHRLLHNLPFDFYNFVDQRHLDDLLYNFLYGSVLNNRLLYDFLDLLNSISVYNLLYDNLHFDWLLDNVMNFYDFLDDLGNFDDFLYCLNNGDDFFDNSVHRLVPDLNVVSNFRSRHILNSLNYFLYDFFNFDYFGHFDSNLYNLLYNLVNWNGLFDDFSGGHYFLSDKFDVSIFDHGDDNFSLNLSVLFDFDWLLDDFLYMNHFGHFSDNLNYFFNNFRNLNDFLYNSGHFNQFLHDESFEPWHFDRNIDCIFHNLILPDFNWSLNSPFHFNNFGNFNNSFDNPFNYLFDLYNFGCDSVHFQDIVHINNVHYLLSDHADHSLVNFRHHSTSEFHLLHFLQ